MLNFIQGKPGSGKTHFLIKTKLAAHINAGREVVMLVPRQLTFTTDKAVLDYLGPKTACEVEVLSFKRLAETLFTQVEGTGKKPVKDSVSAIILSRILTSLQDELVYYNKKVDNNLVHLLLEQLRFFKTHNVTAENLAELKSKTTGNLYKKLSDLALIFQAYTDAVSKAYYDENDLLTEVYNIILKDEYFKGKIVAVDGFSQFTMQEMLIISLAVEQAEEVYVTVCSDNIYSQDKASVFAHVNRSMNRFKSVVQKHCSNVIFNDYFMSELNGGYEIYTNPCLRTLEQSLYKTDAFSDEDCSAITLFKAHNVDEECDFVARKIKQLIRFENYRCRDITVAFRSFGEYKNRLANSFKKYDIPYFEDKRQPVRNTPLFVFVSALLDFCVNATPDTENILRYLKSGLSPLSDKEISDLENYAYIWSLNGAQWKSPFVKDPGGFGKEMDDKRKQQLEKLEATRLKFIPSLVAFSEDVKDCTGREFCEKLYNYIVDNNVKYTLKKYAISLENDGNIELALEQNTVWDILMQAIDEMATALADAPVNSKEFRDYFDLVIDSKSLGKIPNHYDEIMICSFDRLMNSMPKVLFSVGCVDGAFPKYDDDTGVFSGFERDILSETDIEFTVVPDELDAILYERFLVYQSLTSARDKLFVTCSETDLEAGKTEPSEIFGMVKRCFKNLDFVEYDDSISETVQSEASAFEQFVKHTKKDTVEASSLKEYFSNREDYESKVSVLEAMKTQKPFAIEKKDLARDLFGVNMSFSASSMNDYAMCPFMYFCKRGLRLEEIKKAKYDALNIGNVSHFVLENLIKAHSKDDFNVDNEAALNEEAVQLMTDYLDKKMGGREDKDAQFIYTYFRTKRILADTIKRLIIEFDKTVFEPAEFELKISGENGIPSLRIPLDNGYIELNGSIDRVDAYQHDGSIYIKIVDYKTGSKKFELSKILEGLDTQMLLYLIAVLENGQEKFGDSIKPAAVLYTLVKEVTLDGSKPITISNVMSNAETTGMVVDDDEVAGSVYISDEKTSKSFMKNRFTQRDFELISNHVKKLVSDMGNNMHNGVIAAYPYKTGSGDYAMTGCKYCDYRTVCHSENGVKYRYIKSEKFDESIKKLREEDENE